MVGLQALSKFSVCTASLDLMMECTISSEVDPTFEERVAINKQRSQVDHNVVVCTHYNLLPYIIVLQMNKYIYNKFDINFKCIFKNYTECNINPSM